MPCKFQDTITKKAFLASLQISDSFFPVGGFNHSFGLETYIQEGIISSGDELKNFLEIYLNELIKYTISSLYTLPIVTPKAKSWSPLLGLTTP